MTKSLNLKWALSGVIGLAILIWLAILVIKGVNVADSWAAIKEIPTVVGWLTPVGLWFATWGWRCRIFKGWLVLVPDLNGTWEGEFRSEWIDPATQKKIPPKKAFLVIKQTLFEIHCCQMTAESKSYSRAATVQSAPDGHLNVVEFTYSNSPRVSVQHRSQAHDGACSLEVVEKPDRKLVGKYWTERNTKGEMDFKFLSKEMRQEFGG